MNPSKERTAKMATTDTPSIKIPVWLWTLLGLATAFAFTHTVKQYVTDDRVATLMVDQKKSEAEIAKLTEEVQDLSTHVDTVDGIAIDLREVRTLVREVRDDVLTLKAHNKPMD